MKKVRALAIINSVSLFALLVISLLVQYKILNSNTVREITARYGSVFTPADVTYMLWGPIYLGLAAFCGYHLVVSFKHDYESLANRDIRIVGSLFAMNNIIGIAWLLAWSNDQLLLGTIFMFAQALLVWRINIRLKIHDEQRKLASKSFTQFPFSIYFAWITVAALTCLGTLLTSNGWVGMGLGLTAAQFGIVLITLTTMITVLVVILRRNVSYGLVIMWVMYGIILQRQEAAVSSPSDSDVMQMAWMGAGIISLICLYQMIRNFVHENELFAAEDAWLREERTGPSAAPDS